MRVPRRLSWLVVLAIVAAGGVVAWQYYRTQSAVRLHRRTPLVGVIPIARPAAPLPGVPQPATIVGETTY